MDNEIPIQDFAKNVTMSMPPVLGYTLNSLNMRLEQELTNLFINALIDLSISIIKGKSLEIIDIVKLAKMYNIDYSNESTFKSLIENLSLVIAEFTREIIAKELENYDIVIITCFSEKILIRKGLHYGRFDGR